MKETCAKEKQTDRAIRFSFTISLPQYDAWSQSMKNGEKNTQERKIT